MSLVTCSECGHTVSTMAAGCPKCGAPPPAAPPQTPTSPIDSAAVRRPSWGRLFGLAAATFLIGGAVLVAILVNSQPATVDHVYATRLEPTTVPVAPQPTHHYVAIVRGYFGYSTALSDDDRARGIASKPLTLVGYQGKRGGEYSFSVSDGGPYVEMVSCVEPCDVAQAMGMGGSHVFQVQPGTLLGDIIDDARNGQLDVDRSGAPADIPRTN